MPTDKFLYIVTCWQPPNFILYHTMKRVLKAASKPTPISVLFCENIYQTLLTIYTGNSGTPGGLSTLELPIAIRDKEEFLEVIALTAARDFCSLLKLAQSSFNGDPQST